MTMTAWVRISVAMALAPVLASAQPAFQPPPPAFQTPSGNVHCRWDAGALRCQAQEFDATAPGVPSCTPPWPGLLSLRPTGHAETPCRGAALRNEDDFVLGYGARWIGAGVTCESEEAGLRCANGAGHGFQISRSRLTLF
ncbi:DUF6636 domain-containing protein [Falsiroseomonas oryzae]|uniref:DUF6636 domain-containing protein n=1 Tax=Falsiroseomonas oryzae TaxID=2766473 RepID=UPI0022EA123C|nr:DUF6636 domain-containing protein [Roseomonas sp. MO-31]